MKTLVAIPCLDTVATPFCRSLAGLRYRPGDQVEITFSQNSLIYDSRNLIAQKAIENRFDRILWLDSDMVFPPDLYERMSAHLDSGIEYISGLYTTRKQEIKPVIYKKLDFAGGPVLETFEDYPTDTVFPIAASGFGAVMMTRELLETVSTFYGPPFYPVHGMGEDIAFCYRVKLIGRRMYCDSRIKLGHVGTHIFEV